MNDTAIKRDSLLASRFLAVCQALFAVLFAGLVTSRIHFLLIDCALPLPVLAALFILLAAALLFLTRYMMKRGEKTASLFAAITLGLACLYGFTFFHEGERSVYWLLLGIFLVWFFRRQLGVKSDRRTLRIACALGCLFGTFFFLGYQLEKENRFMLLYVKAAETLGVYTLCLWLIKGLSMAVLFVCILHASFVYLKDRSMRTDRPYGSKGGMKRFFGTALLLILAWLPWFIAFYPGLLTRDSIRELNQQLGLEAMSSHHPFIHQMMIRLALTIGSRFSSPEASIAAYSVIQMLFMAVCFSLCIEYLRRLGAAGWLRAAGVAFFALFPINAIYSVTMWKDVPFAGCALVFSILLLQAGTQSAVPQKRRRDTALLILFGFLFCTMRNNGFYAFLLGFPLFALFNRKQIGRWCCVFAAVLLLMLGYRGLMNGMGVVKGRSAEMLSVPLQQIARVAARSGADELESEEFAVLREVFPEPEKLGELYAPTISDPIKREGVFESEVFDADPGRYAKAWLKLGLRHPVTYLEAFLLLNYGYWYPDVNYWQISTTLRENALGAELNMRHGIFRLNLLTVYNNLASHQPLSFLFCLALVVWLLMWSAALLLVKRQNGWASTMLPLAALWLTTLASPVHAEYRYLYAAVVCLPLFISVSLTVPSKEN